MAKEKAIAEMSLTLSIDTSARMADPNSGEVKSGIPTHLLGFTFSHRWKLAEKNADGITYASLRMTQIVD